MSKCCQVKLVNVKIQITVMFSDALVKSDAGIPCIWLMVSENPVSPNMHTVPIDFSACFPEGRIECVVYKERVSHENTTRIPLM